MAGRNKRSTKKQAPPRSSSSPGAFVASSQRVTSIESNVMRVNETVKRDGKRDDEGIRNNARAIQTLENRFRSLDIGNGFPGISKYHPNIPPVTPPFSPQMIGKVGPATAFTARNSCKPQVYTIDSIFCLHTRLLQLQLFSCWPSNLDCLST